MAAYRVFFRDNTGLLKSSEEFEAEDDAAATTKAADLARKLQHDGAATFEVLQKGRIISEGKI
jgi:hypothetical protein